MLVFGYRMVGYEYFMDKMQPYEVETMIEAIPYADRPTWEQTRLKIFSTASMFSKNALSVTDIMRFKWDEEQGEPQTDITQTDIDRLKKQAKLFETTLTNDGRL